MADTPQITGNIVALKGIAAPGEQPVGEVISYCEKLLADARSGALRAVATAEVRQGGAISHGFAYGASMIWTLGGAVLVLQSLFVDKFKNG